MLSEETAVGKYPVEAVAMMETIVMEAEQHDQKRGHNRNLL
jgi:pyruvate kinase